MWRNLVDAVRELQRTFEDAFDPYRPELHYMRGPGPKWRAKRAGTVEPKVRGCRPQLKLGCNAAPATAGSAPENRDLLVFG